MLTKIKKIKRSVDYDELKWFIRESSSFIIWMVRFYNKRCMLLIDVLISLIIIVGSWIVLCFLYLWYCSCCWLIDSIDIVIIEAEPFLFFLLLGDIVIYSPLNDIQFQKVNNWIFYFIYFMLLNFQIQIFSQHLFDSFIHDWNKL